MIFTPGQPRKRYGLGAVHYHVGEMAVLVRLGKRRRGTAELPPALVGKHLTDTIYSIHQGHSSRRMTNSVKHIEGCKSIKIRDSACHQGLPNPSCPFANQVLCRLSYVGSA
jgi:hypothetical protein